MSRPSYSFFLSAIGVCILACCLHAILFSFGFYAISADESGRTLDAYQWASDHTRQSEVWLPYSAVTTGLALSLWKNLFIVPRILCLFWGCCTVLALACYSYELFRDKQVTIITSFAATLFPPLLILSHVPLPDITFIFFIVLSMYFFLRWSKYKGSYSLYLTAFCLTMSSSIRYEGWAFVLMFILGMILEFIYNQKEKTKDQNAAIPFAILLSACFPIFWMTNSILLTGNPISFVVQTGHYFSAITKNSILKLIWHNVGAQFVVQNLLTLNFLGLISIILAWKSRKELRKVIELQFAALICMIVISIIAHTLPTHNSWRIAVVWNCLLLPFTVFWLFTYFKSDKNKSSYFRYILSLLIGLSFCIQMGRMSSLSSFSQNDYHVGKELEKRISVSNQNGNMVLIESSAWNYLHVITVSQHPELFIYNSGFNPNYPEHFIVNPPNDVDCSKLADLHIRFLVFRTDLYKKKIEKTRNIERLSEHGEWTLYEVSKGIKEIYENNLSTHLKE